MPMICVRYILKIELTEAVAHSQSSPPGTPVKNRSAKAKMHIDPASVSLLEVSHLHGTNEDYGALHNAIAAFPTSNQPVMDTTLKDMLMSL